VPSTTMTHADPVPILGTNLAVLVFHAAPIRSRNSAGVPDLPTPEGATTEDLELALASGWAHVTELEGQSGDGLVFVHVLRKESV